MNPPALKAKSRARFTTGLTVAVSGVLVACSTSSGSGSQSESNAARWSDYPHTMGCVLDDNPAPDWYPPPKSITAEKVTLSHARGDQLRVTIEFVAPLPPTPSTLPNGNGQTENAIGSITFGVNIQNGGFKDSLSILSPSRGEPWRVNPSSDTDLNPNVLQSARASSNILTLDLDLTGEDALLGSGPFEPLIQLGGSVALDQPPYSGRVSPVAMYDSQRCEWNTPARGSSSTATASPPSRTAPAHTQIPTRTRTQSSPPVSGHHYTVVDYIRDSGIVEHPVKRGDSGSPTIDLPVPSGWEAAGQRTPEWAYGAIVSTNPAFASDPPSIMALVSKLTGNVDPTKVLEFAPGEIKNLPGFKGSNEAAPSKLSGFEATQIGGTYKKNGVIRAVAQKTVVIPGKDGLYVLQLNADCLEDQIHALRDATVVIDEQTRITP